MYKNKEPDGRHNLCGIQIQRLRKACRPRVSQRALAEALQLQGMDLDKNAIQRIESGQRFVTDLELEAFARHFKVRADELLRREEQR